MEIFYHSFLFVKNAKIVDNIIMKYYLVMVSSCQKYVVTHDACRPLFTLSLIFTTSYVITFRHLIFLIAIVLQFKKKMIAWLTGVICHPMRLILSWNTLLRLLYNVYTKLFIHYSLLFKAKMPGTILFHHESLLFTFLTSNVLSCCSALSRGSIYLKIIIGMFMPSKNQEA